jgi:hypothetical protein
MQRRVCKVCGEVKHETDYYSGVLSRCKECHKAAVRAKRAEKAEYYRDYDRKRYRENPDWAASCRRASKNWYWNNREEAMERQREWRKSNPAQYRAHNAVSNALRDGTLAKGSCHFCGAKEVHAHHHDYSKPLEVTWLCPMCHSRFHQLHRMTG